LVFVLLAGCPKPEDKPDAKTIARPLEGLKLRLAVVDDPALVEAVTQVRGEWNLQTGAELQVEKLSEKDLADADTLPADAVLCPSHLLGTLAERNLLAPVPQRILHDAEWGGVFELLKLREAAFGGRIMAVPFGSPVFCCYYRADLLEKLGHRPPRTWAEYQELAKLLADKGRGEKNWCGAIEPLGQGWGGLVLLARAAAYAKHRDNYSALFNIETMEPLVAGPPFVQALEELVATAKSGPADPLHYDPTEARAAFWRGECGIVLSWPTAADQGKRERGERREERGLVALATSIVGFCELPGSRRVYNLSTGAWDARAEEEDARVPLLAIAGRLGVVNAKSSNIDAAFQLLLWLSDSRMSPQISAASSSTTLFRQSNLKSPGRWVEKPVSALAAVQYGDATEAALSHEQWIGALRIPGRAKYLAALDEAVASAVRGEKSPLDALVQAEKKWREITGRLGLEHQRAAYRHSLGLD
jgi:multiple sugar transport system substrate-binding protein